MKWFTNVSSKEEVKKQYKELAMKHHPDKGGKTEDMQEINNEYEKLMQGKFDEKRESTQSYMNIISEIIKYDVNVENIGTWVWVSGSKTITIKEELKVLGFKWSGSRKMWYFAEGVEGKRKATGIPTDTLRQVYGSNILKTESKPQRLG